ncbi:PilW family protein [Marinobacter sp. JSM 1782161]|uniref:PilW family protein n=1 Tax=Marinobacter sp. JSM 1782161 TaxID=2685906 RepID=UPI0014025525|nr:PilW family protein [Marinobacter sp. JSM 1782161]
MSLNMRLSRRFGLSGQQGLSIIELMVALALGALLTIGLVQIFTSNSQTFRLNEAEARAQEAGRISTDIVSRALRNSGYFGCYPINPVTNNLDTTDDDYQPGLYDYEFDGLSAENAFRPNDAVAGTDFFAVSGLRSSGGVAAEADVVSASIEVDDEGNLEAGSIIMINDCENGDIFEISEVQNDGTTITLVGNNQDNVDGQPGNDFSANAPAACPAGEDCLGSSYDEGVQIRNPYTEIYYIGTGPTGNPALFFRDASGSAVELVDNVVDMAVRFGEGTVNGGVTNWEDNPASVADWGGVMAVQTSFLVRAGQNNVIAQAMSYCFPGWLDCTDDNNLTTAPDQRLYRVYTLTTTLRNRID